MERGYVLTHAVLQVARSVRGQDLFPEVSKCLNDTIFGRETNESEKEKRCCWNECEIGDQRCTAIHPGHEEDNAPENCRTFKKDRSKDVERDQLFVKISRDVFALFADPLFVQRF